MGNVPTNAFLCFRSGRHCDERTPEWHDTTCCMDRVGLKISDSGAAHRACAPECRRTHTNIRSVPWRGAFTRFVGGGKGIRNPSQKSTGRYKSGTAPCIKGLLRYRAMCDSKPW